MVERHLKYLPKLAVPTMHAVDRIWDVNSIKKFEDQEHLLGKGRMKKMRGNILIIVKIYINNTYKVSFFVYMIILINILI
jgi:hypothetical protein